MENKPKIKKSSMRKMSTKERLKVYFKMRERLEYMQLLRGEKTIKGGSR